MLFLFHLPLFLAVFIGAAPSPSKLISRIGSRGTKELKRIESKPFIEKTPEIELSLDYEEMVLFEADVVEKIVQTLNNKMKNFENKCKKHSKRTTESEKGASSSSLNDSLHQKSIDFFEELKSVFVTIERDELRTKYQRIVEPFSEFLGQNKKGHTDPENWAFFQLNAVATLGLALAQLCLTENDNNKEEVYTWWRLFRETFAQSKMSHDHFKSDDNNSQIIRKTLFQHCNKKHRIYESVLDNLHAKRKQNILWFNINLTSLEGKKVSELEFKNGELDEAKQIELSVYDVSFNGYKKFKHIALFVGKTEIHYGMDGVYVTKLGRFGKPPHLIFAKKVKLSNVITRHSVRQIQSVVDYLDLGPYIKHSPVRKNCSDFTKDLLKLIALTKPAEEEDIKGEEVGKSLKGKEESVAYGKYPPVDTFIVEYLEQRPKEIQINANSVELEFDSDVGRNEFKNVNFLSYPLVVQFVKDSPIPVQVGVDNVIWAVQKTIKEAKKIIVMAKKTRK